MQGAQCGVRWCTLPVEIANNAGVLAAIPFLPADATVVGLIIHSHCYQLSRYGPDGQLFLPDAREQAIKVRASDRAWPDSPGPGPECRCSRCRQPIESELPVRATCAYGEYRFHGRCLGLTDPPTPPPEFGTA